MDCIQFAILKYYSALCLTIDDLFILFYTHKYIQKIGHLERDGMSNSCELIVNKMRMNFF